jgi:hypothetical protein
MTRKQLEKKIKDVIKLHYGYNLWAYHPDLEYEESIASFVQSLADLTQDWLPTKPPLGYRAIVSKGKRKIVVDPVQAAKIRELVELHNNAPDVRVVQVNAKAFIEAIKKDAKNPEDARFACGMIEAAVNGDEELAGVLARMIRAEWRHLANGVR